MSWPTSTRTVSYTHLDVYKRQEYLGLNADEEDVWVDESDEALQELLDSQKA